MIAEELENIKGDDNYCQMSYSSEIELSLPDLQSPHHIPSSEEDDGLATPSFPRDFRTHEPESSDNQSDQQSDMMNSNTTTVEESSQDIVERKNIY